MRPPPADSHAVADVGTAAELGPAAELDTLAPTARRVGPNRADRTMREDPVAGGVRLTIGAFTSCLAPVVVVPFTATVRMGGREPSAGAAHEHAAGDDAGGGASRNPGMFIIRRVRSVAEDSHTIARNQFAETSTTADRSRITLRRNDSGGPTCRPDPGVNAANLLSYEGVNIMRWNEIEVPSVSISHVRS